MLASLRFWAEPSFLIVIDSSPIGEGRIAQPVGGKSKDTKDKGRRTDGIHSRWVLNEYGQVVDWAATPLTRISIR